MTEGPPVSPRPDTPRPPIYRMPYFSPTTDPKIRWDKVDHVTLEMLEAAREHAGIPFRITSTYRDPEHSASVGGSKTDAHTENPCTAFDIAWSNTEQLHAIVDGAFLAGFERIGINPFNNHVHLDNSPSLPRPRLWIETPEALVIKWLELRGYAVTKK